MQPSLQCLVEQFLLQQMRGDRVSAAEFAARYPQWSPQLESALRRAELISRARQSLPGREPPAVPATAGNAESCPGSSHGQLQIRCPECRAVLTVDADTAWAQLVCQDCQHEFSLVGRDASHVPLTQLGHFEILSRVGMGAFGTVWKARDTSLDRLVALKVPRQGQLSARDVELFLREARAAAQLQHPYIVAVYEVGRLDDHYFIASEFLSGGTLADQLPTDRPDMRESIELVSKLAQALVCAHGAGIIHRDLKPGNILLDEAGHPHITDFGLAKQEGTEVAMTYDGLLIGTPAYMAPEQASGTPQKSDARSDIYSLGVVLFQLLTGELPFRGNASQMLQQVIHDEPPSPRKLNALVSRDMETICLRCLEKQPEKRFATAAELDEELQRVLHGQPILSRPIGRVARLARWSSRHPLAAGLSCAVVVCLLLGTGVSTFFASRAQRQAWRAAQALDEADRSLYAAKMTQVQTAVDGGNVERGLRLLDEYAPGSPRAALRGPEWHYWWRHIFRRQVAVHHGDARIRGLAVSPDRSVIAWGDHRGQRYVADGRLQQVRQLAGQHPADVHDMAFCPDNDRLVSVSTDGTILVSRVTSGNVCHTWQHPGPFAHCLAVSPDGRWLAVGGLSPQGETGLLAIWPLADLSADDPQVITLPQEVARLAWTADARGLYVSTDSCVMRVERGGGTLVPNLVECRREFAVDGSRAMMAVQRGGTRSVQVKVELMSLQDSSRRVSLDRPTTEFVSELQFSPDGTRLAVPVASRSVEIYDTESGELQLVLRGHRNRVLNTEFLKGSELVSVGDDGSVRVWDLRPTAELDGAFHRRTRVAADPANGHLQLSSHGDRMMVIFNPNVEIWDTVRQERRRSKSGPQDTKFRGRVTAAAIAPAGDQVAVGYTHHLSSLVELWTVDTDQCVELDRVDQRVYTALSFSPDGSRLALVSTDGAAGFPGRPADLRIVDLRDSSGTLVLAPDDTEDPWRPHRMTVSDLEFSPDGRRLYSSGIRDRSVKCWDAVTGSLLFSFRRPANIHGATAVAVAPDDAWIAAAWRDHLITIIDRHGQMRNMLHGHDGAVTALCVSGEGQSLISAGWDRRVNVWDARTGQLRSSLAGHKERVTGVGLTPDDQWIISCDVTGHLRFWDCRTVERDGTAAEGSRLSVQSVRAAEFAAIVKLGGRSTRQARQQ